MRQLVHLQCVSANSLLSPLASERSSLDFWRCICTNVCAYPTWFVYREVQYLITFLSRENRKKSNMCVYLHAANVFVCGLCVICTRGHVPLCKNVPNTSSLSHFPFPLCPFNMVSTENDRSHKHSSVISCTRNAKAISCTPSRPV